MKLYKSIFAALALMATSVALTGCNEDEVMAPIVIPSTDMKANTTIADLKNKYWQSDDNYYQEVGLTETGEHVIIAGRVIGNDLTGNIYQTVMVQDATGALNVSVSMKELYLRYKIGGQVVIDITGLCVGKYAGLFCLGKGEIYNNTTPQVGRMEEETWLEHSAINGLPDPSKMMVYDVTIPEILAMRDATALKQWQSQRVRIKNVSFIGGGETTWGEVGSSAVNRYLIDADGKRLTVRASSYSDFSDQVMPAGHGTVEAILSYFNGTWQLAFVTNEDCYDFGGESYAPEALTSTGDGSAANPYNVGAVINGVAAGTDVWVTGYIVGWIDGMSMVDGAKFTVPATVVSNILLAATPDTRDVTLCIPVALPSGSDARTNLNLKDNPGNLGAQVCLKGSIETYFSAKGVKNVSDYTFSANGNDPGTAPDPGTSPDPNPDPAGSSTFKKVTTITSGKKYVMVIGNKLGKAIGASETYGRLSLVDVTITGDQLTTDDVNAITITAVDGAYTMTDSYGRLLAMDSSHLTSFQLDYTDGKLWSITPENGLFRITSLLNPDCCVVRSGTYTNIAPSDIVKYPTYDLPALYEKI